MGLVEEIGQTETPSDSELAEIATQMEAWRQHDPKGFEAMMAATIASKAAGDNPEVAMKKLEQLLTAQQAAKVAHSGVELPGNSGTKLGPDGTIQRDAPGIDIVPSPGFVVKTRRTDVSPGAVDKVFLNLCTHTALGAPHLKKKLDDEGKEVEGWNIPLGVGPPRACTDHKGAPALVYDCVVNPKVVEDAEADETGADKDFLVQLAVQYVESKYKCALDRRYKLPKLNYKSSSSSDPKEVATQRVRDASKLPSIQEVSSTSSGAGGTGSGAKKSGAKKGGGPSGAGAAGSQAPDPVRLPAALSLVGADGVEAPSGAGAHAASAEKSCAPGGGGGAPAGEGELARRRNYFDDSGALPRVLVVTAGPLCPWALAHAADAKVEATEYGLTLSFPGHTPVHVPFPYAGVASEAEARLRPTEAMIEVSRH